MRKNYIHIDFKGITPLAGAFRGFLEHLKMLGYDGILLELDCKYAWKSWAGAAREQYSRADVEFIIATAKALGFEVSLLIQAMGHLEWCLQFEQFAHLRENGFINELCPSVPESAEKISGWIEEAVELCPDAPYLHLGGDEVYHLCTCPKCRERAAALPDHEMGLYVEYMKPLCRKVLSHGMRPMLWSDMFVNRNAYETIKTLSAETVIVNWCYHEKAPFAGLKEMLATGYEIWGAPAIRCGWGPDWLSGLYEKSKVDLRVENIRQWQQTGVNLLNTVWGRPSGLNVLYPPVHCYADALAAAGNDGELWNVDGDAAFAVETRRYRELAEKYAELRLKANVIYQVSKTLNIASRYVGRRPGLFKADVYDQADKLAADAEKLRAETAKFFVDNQLSDAEEFLEERFSLLEPHIVEPPNPELERSEQA